MEVDRIKDIKLLRPRDWVQRLRVSEEAGVTPKFLIQESGPGTEKMNQICVRVPGI